MPQPAMVIGVTLGNLGGRCSPGHDAYDAPIFHVTVAYDHLHGDSKAGAIIGNSNGLADSTAFPAKRVVAPNQYSGERVRDKFVVRC
jgi:hypothetical protein